MRRSLLTILRLTVAGALLVLTLALPGDAVTMASRPAPYLTPGCQPLAHSGEVEMLATLQTSDYACTESLAAVLGATARDAAVTQLLERAATGSTGRVRRNALRVLGRMAERHPGDLARERVLHYRATELRTLLLDRLSADSDVDVLNDAIWIVDTFLYPFFEAQPALEALSAAVDSAPSLRSRAAAAVARLIYARGAPTPADISYTLAALRSDDAGVRAQAALIAARFAGADLAPGARAQLVTTLRDAYAAAALLAELPAVKPGTVEQERAQVERVVAQVAARANLAAALDRYDGGTSRFAEEQAAFEERFLPLHLLEDGIMLRGAAAAGELAALLARLRALRGAFFELVGPELLAEPVEAGDGSVAVLVFPSQATYRAYMAAFVGVTAETDGVYVEDRATLYTYERQPSQTEHTLAESLQHEFGHHLAGRYLFPGRWHDPGYHAEPKGWADEGLAELLAGLVFDARGGYSAPLRTRQVERLCGAGYLRDLPTLLGQRSGYDQFGTFDYDGAWAFSYYLLTERPEVARRLFNAYRAGRYRLADFAAIAGVPSVLALQRDWHAAIVGWCASRL